ncbi:IGHMBP2 family helicase [Halarsenatibacter silvermanii]|uniref:DNA helicase n=1 Tax=Halarsenatibacter silvermanii TaxID=321763 RepID=A0A1G9NEJ8_9FIRM|nr:IGHMBP2 family helicase [Halarsenatibacter silvermanii]SDL84721.1 DNA helicase, putative [Halarsenatibacter silvermanii]
MVKIIISEFDHNIGPGDIVGAFINECGIDSEDIGKININDHQATVELAEEVAAQVVKNMDGNQIGGGKVCVDPASPEEILSPDLVQYIKKFTGLVELEREEEMKQHELEIKHLSAREREKKGRAILHLKGRDEGTALGQRSLVKFMRQRPGEKLPETEITVGDLVMLSKKDPLADDNPTGTVAEMTNYSLTVVFDEKPQGFVYGKSLRMDLYVNDITYQRMLDAVESLEKVDGAAKRLRDIMILNRRPAHTLSQAVEVESWFDDELDSSQKEAVNSALSSRDYHLIQGPPGTGKTMTAIEIIQQAARRGEKVLATADSNVAVDNLVERLADTPTEAIRIGHPVRVSPLLRDHTLDYRVQEHEDYQQAQELRRKAENIKHKQDDLIHPSGRYRRGMSNEQIKDLAQKGRGSRGVSPEKIKQMARWLELQEEIDEIYDEINRLEDKAVDELIDSADVICVTNSTAGSELMEDRRFDLVTVDEATQATEPATLIPLLKGERVILIGDHKQLPPTVKNQQASEQGLSKSLFERVIEEQGRDFWSLLKVQYRMHDKIMEFSSNKFYNCKLESDEQVADHTLADLGAEPDETSGILDEAFMANYPVVFLDTADMESYEKNRADSPSYFNPVEAEMITDLASQAMSLGLEAENIGVISPYKDQVDEIDNHNLPEELERKTVDGFQGREKELILLSLVRSNKRGNIGFLRDLRRLNVSITRARRKLIIVGDSSTVGTHELYAELIDYIRKSGLYYRL